MQLWKAYMQCMIGNRRCDIELVFYGKLIGYATNRR